MKKNQNERIAFEIIVVVTCLENLQIENKTINLIQLDCFNIISFVSGNNLFTLCNQSTSGVAPPLSVTGGVRV